MDSLLIFATQDPSLLTTILAVTKAIVLVVVGVNMLIIVHEWGHFVVARMCGVKCEKFYIWFDIFGLKFFKFKWGDTEYGLGVLPLGGYVKMLGQEDNPGRLREELEKAKTTEAEDGDEADGKSRPADKIDLAAAEAALFDPDSYLSKSVPQRMAIISAGVIMNVVFAFVVAAIAYGMGVFKVDSGIGHIAPGGAAWRADIRVGDRITSVAGRPISQFDKLREATMLGDTDDGLPIVIERPGVDGPVNLTVQPDRDLGAPTIGISGPNTTTLNRESVADFGMPAYHATPAVEPNDRIVAVNGQPITQGYEFHRAEALGRDEPMQLTVERGATDGKSGEEITVTVAPRPMRRLGLVMAAGPIRGVQADSPAEKAGLKKGDRITAVNGQPLGDPLTLENRLRQIAADTPEGKSPRVELTIAGRDQPVGVDLRSVDWYETPIFGTEHPSMPSLGITIEMTPKVAAVVKGSPAETAGIRPGDVVATVTSIAPDAAAREKYGIPKRYQMPEATLDLTKNKTTWAGVFYMLQNWLPGTVVQLELANGNTVKLKWEEAPDWNHPDRGFMFEPSETFIQAKTVGQAFAHGVDETRNSLMMVFKFLGKVGTQQISPRMIGGPWTIVKIAYYYATSRFTAFLLFLCIISANLAVINFLPIPVLDGGHMVFLAYEGIRGKPPSENVQIGLSYVGLFLLLALMVWVFGLDLGFISRQ